MPNITLKDVAQRAEVSVSLVSKVLTGKMGNSTVSDEKAKKILAVAKEMGYVPNNSARRLRTGKGNTIAVIVPFGETFYNSIYYSFLEGVLDKARDSKYDFITEFYYWQKKELDCLQRVLNLSVDGVIYFASRMAEGSEQCREAVEVIVKSGIPTLVISKKTLHVEGSHFFDLDEVSSGRTATEYCLSKGFTDILLVESLDINRNKGYYNAMADAGLEPMTIKGYPYFDKQTGYSCFQDIYCKYKNNLPEAIIATCDINAIGIINAMHNFGLSQNDITVVGIDGLESVPSIYPYSFPSVRQPTKKMGRDAVDSIIEFIETGNTGNKRYFQDQIING